MILPDERAPQIPAWLLLAAAALGPGCSFVLDFDPAVVDAAQFVPDACTWPAIDATGLLEPNEDVASAAPLTAGTYPLEINPRGDQDYFAIDVPAPVSLDVVLTFEGCGDLDMELLFGVVTGVFADAGDADAAPPVDTGTTYVVVTESRNSRSASEHMALSAAQVTNIGTGTYILHVFDFNNETVTPYELVVTMGN